MKKISEIIDEMQATKHSKMRYVDNWREMLPEGSRWTPGDKGNPACTSCKGIGYLRVDVPVAHPNFGQLFECECVSGMIVTINPNKGLNLPKPK